MLEYAAVFKFIDVRRIIFTLLAADAALAAVSCKIALTVRELLHRNETLIPAFPASVRTGLGLKAAKLLRSEKRRVLRSRFKCKNCCPIGPHEARNIGTNDFLSDEVLKRAQDCIVVERPPLHDNMVAESGDILQLHHLEQCIFNNGKSNARRDVGDLRPLFLCLLDFRVHKDRTARSEVNGRLCIDRLARELSRSHMQPLGEVLDERTAARRTRLVECDISDTAVLHEKALHVLSANIQHKADLRAELLRGTQMGKSLHLSAVCMQRSLHDRLTVSCCHCACDV